MAESIVVKYWQGATESECGLCQAEIMGLDFRPELHIEGTGQVVCSKCGYEAEPNLRALCELAAGSEEYVETVCGPTG